MCGLAGVSIFPGTVIHGEATRDSLFALEHRGPDDAGTFEDFDAGVLLIHARLSILDTSSLGHQPMSSEDGRVVLAFNGEIYNFLELRSELEGKGYSFRGRSDTEVLLCLYLDQKSRGLDINQMLRRLNGVFAFALWDSDRQEILLVRDALGVKPLYFSVQEGRVAFASEIKALVPLVVSLGDLDYPSINRYLTYLWCPGEGTPVKGVRKVGPGEALWLREGKVKERIVWYRLPAFKRNRDYVSKREAIVGTVQHLRRAVHRQMVADVPVGAFLSGGLDSSSVVAFARELNPDIHCFTIEFRGDNSEGITNDLPYARRVAKHLDVPLEVVQVDSVRMAQDLENMVFQLDEPLADPAPLNVLYISSLARREGIKVLLSGAGGDDIFTGYRRHFAVSSERLWNWLPRLALGGVERMSARLDSRKAIGRRLRKLFNGASLDSDARLVNYFRWIRRDDLLALYTREFRLALGDNDADSTMLDFLSEVPNTSTSLQRMLALEQRYFLSDHNLTYTDKMSMAVGVEVRVPFLDIDLVEFADRIPMYFKQHRAEGKWVLKKAMETYLPRDVIYRPKSGFGAPLRHWIRVELRELLGDVLSESSLRSRGLFDYSAVNRMIAANEAGEIDASYTLLSLLCIELWCRRFLDRSSVTISGAPTPVKSR